MEHRNKPLKLFCARCIFNSHCDVKQSIDLFLGTNKWRGSLEEKKWLYKNEGLLSRNTFTALELISKLLATWQRKGELFCSFTKKKLPFFPVMQSFEEETEKTSFSRQKPQYYSSKLYTFPSQIKVKRKNIIAIPGAQKFPGVTRKLR